jgi:hypothetical protein
MEDFFFEGILIILQFMIDRSHINDLLPDFIEKYIPVPAEVNQTIAHGL